MIIAAKDVVEPLGRPLSTGCHDCDQITGGHCWRHGVTYHFPVTYVTQPIVLSPELLPESDSNK